MNGYTSTTKFNRDRKIHAIGKPAIRFYNYSEEPVFNDFPPQYYVNGKNVSNIVNEWLEERNVDIDNLSNEDYYALCIFMEGL